MHAWAQSMFNLNTHDPGTECFTPGMRDLVLMHAPSASFGSLMAILAPYAGHHISNVTMMVASLGEAESQRQQKAVWAVSQAPSAPQSSNPVQVTTTRCGWIFWGLE